MNIKEHIEAGHYPTDAKGRALVPMGADRVAVIYCTDHPADYGKSQFCIIGRDPVGRLRVWNAEGANEGDALDARHPHHRDARAVPGAPEHRPPGCRVGFPSGPTDALPVQQRRNRDGGWAAVRGAGAAAGWRWGSGMTRLFLAWRIFRHRRAMYEALVGCEIALVRDDDERAAVKIIRDVRRKIEVWP